MTFLLAAASPSATDFVRPTDIALQDSLNELEVCRSPNPSECWSPKRAYNVHGASCIPIAPENGKPTIACRVDLTLTYEDSKRGYTRYHDSCTRFSKREVRDSKPEWEVLQIRDRPCEIPSMLKSDPNPLPAKAQIEGAIVQNLTCYDFDGITHCGDQPETASLESFRCMPTMAGEEYQVRVACRVTGDVRYSIRRRVHRFDNICIRLDRTTDADRSPASWIVRYVPEETPCEVR